MNESDQRMDDFMRHMERGRAALLRCDYVSAQAHYFAADILWREIVADLNERLDRIEKLVTPK